MLFVLAQRARWRISRALRRPRSRYVEQRSAEYLGYWQRGAQALGARLTALGEGIWEIEAAGRRTRVANYMVQIDDPVTLRLAADKPYCHALARRLGLPVVPHATFRLHELDAAWRFMQAQGGEFAIKPARGTAAARGVTLHVATRRELASAAALASLYSEELLVEAMIPMEACRLLYLDGELIHAVRRRGLRVVGDGRASIGALLARRGLARLRSDRATLSTLRAQHLSLDSRPRAGEERVVRHLPASTKLDAELRTVYDEAITHLVYEPTASALARVVRELGSRFAGIDLMTNDPSIPLGESGGVFLEVNTTPGLHHHYVDSAERCPAAIPVLRYLLAGGH
jgi:cyanophycin synthetase